MSNFMCYFLTCAFFFFFTENIQTLREWDKYFIASLSTKYSSYSFSKDLSCAFPHWWSSRPTFRRIPTRVNQNSRSHNRYVTRKEFVWKEDAGAKVVKHDICKISNWTIVTCVLSLIPSLSFSFSPFLSFCILMTRVIHLAARQKQKSRGSINNVFSESSCSNDARSAAVEWPLKSSFTAFPRVLF